MTLKEFAESLDGIIAYGSLPKEVIETAEREGIVIVYGVSDDLVEFDGAYKEEAGCGCGKGGVISFDEYGTSDDGTHHMNDIIAFWYGKVYGEHRGETKVEWVFLTDIPHEDFFMFEDSDTKVPYCRGIVFYKKDMINLLPCPFCGGKAKLMDMGYPHWVYCTECGAKVHGRVVGEGAEKASIEAWNRRASAGR